MTSITVTDDNWINIIDNVNIKDLSSESKKILIDMLSLKTTKESKEYEWEFWSNKRYIHTWEFRRPLKWEYYLSWAIAKAYEAYHDLGTEYYIVKLK